MGILNVFHIKEYKVKIDELTNENNLLRTLAKETERQLEEVMVKKEEYRKQNKQYISNNTELNVRNRMFLNEINEANSVNTKLKNEKMKIESRYQLIKQQKENIELLNNKLQEEKDKILQEVDEIIEENDNLNTQLVKSNIEIENLKLANEKYTDIVGNDYTKIVDTKEIIYSLEQEREEFTNDLLKQKEEVQELFKQAEDLKVIISELKQKIVVLEEEFLLQDFGLYTPMYNFSNSSLYKERLKEVRNQQKEMLKNKTAARCSTTWTVNNSKRAGQKMTNDNIKQILRAFNNECEAIIDKVKFNNYATIKERIKKAYQRLNALNESNDVAIRREYRNLKYEELNLAYEYQVKKQEEREEFRAIKEQQRENMKLITEIEERRREIEKEQSHYNNVLLRIAEQIDREKNEERLNMLKLKKKNIEQNLDDLSLALKEIDYREANQRAGYVYIISNIGAFGENIYKIGMTRRLEPLDRIDELSNASVPFKFDVHAMIFSDDAPKLESALHRAFADKRINLMNSRKEFFLVSLEEIEKVVRLNHDSTIEFIKNVPAQQYRETLQKRKVKYTDESYENDTNLFNND